MKFGSEQNTQTNWDLSDIMLGQTIDMALYGTIIGAIFGSLPVQKYGRKFALILIATLFLISAGSGDFDHR